MRAVTLWSWLEKDRKKALRAGARTLEGMREVGVLLIAFAPLEAALSGEPILHHIRFLFVFLGGGFVLFGLSLLLEWRIDDVE